MLIEFTDKAVAVMAERVEHLADIGHEAAVACYQHAFGIAEAGYDGGVRLGMYRGCGNGCRQGEKKACRSVGHEMSPFAIAPKL